MGKGFIYLHRQIQDCWIWDTGEFDQRSAWIDLLLSANHADIKKSFNGEILTIERGQLMTSIRVLSNRWMWSKDRVTKFLNLLESDLMIKRISDSKRTVITILNYSVYQHNEIMERTVSGQLSDDNRTKIGTNNNDNNDNKYIRKDKSKDLSKRKIFVVPTVDEVKAYCDERKNNIDAEAFVDFYQSKDWMVGKNKMKDWKAAVRLWEKNNKERGVKQNEQHRELRINDEQWRSEHREQLDAVRANLFDV